MTSTTPSEADDEFVPAADAELEDFGEADAPTHADEPAPEPFSDHDFGDREHTP